VAKLPTESSRSDIDDFLKKVADLPARRASGERGRLIFAMDATMSREPTWDRACGIQAEMFRETAALGGLDVQLVYYRGFGECRASRWVGDPNGLLRLMTAVSCRAGHTQIGKVLAHARRETRKRKVDALVFVGDALEEDIDTLGQRAGELGVLGVPAFMFQEGEAAHVRRAFEEVARLTGGAYCPFDSGSAQQLRDLLSAVAVYAAGGKRALAEYGRKRGSETVRLLTGQLRGRE
jgi:hypothetical protein